MRSFGAVVAVIAATTATALLPGALAQASSFEPSEFAPLCTPTDPALQELSGMVVVDEAYAEFVDDPAAVDGAALVRRGRSMVGNYRVGIIHGSNISEE